MSPPDDWHGSPMNYKNVLSFAPEWTPTSVKTQVESSQCVLVGLGLPSLWRYGDVADAA